MTRLKRLLSAAPLALAVMAGGQHAASAHGVAAADAVDRIIAAKTLRCVTIDAALDWNKIDLHGSLVPIEQEFCRALSAALFGDTGPLILQSYHSEQEGLIGLQKGLTDIVIGVTPGVNTAKVFGVRYSQMLFEDGQGFMVHRESGVQTYADMQGRKLCTIDDTDNDPIAMAVLASHGVRPIPFGFQEEGEMDSAIEDRHCEITSAMLSKLAEARSSLRDPKDFIFLPDIVALSPVTAAANAGDDRLIAVMNTTINVVLQAEFLGITQASIAQAGPTDDPRVQHLTGQNWATAQGLGLAHDWSRKVIETVGNYAELYDRTIGPGTAMNLPRGLNALWNHGGLMAPSPLQ
jgi:general L-amino acid transport system substrate-binding protein